MRGNLYLCMQMDSDHHYFPLAFGIHCGNEDTASWTWFLKQLRSAVPTIDNTVVFVSDRDKGLATAVPDVFPQSVRAQLKHRFVSSQAYK